MYFNHLLPLFSFLPPPLLVSFLPILVIGTYFIFITNSRPCKYVVFATGTVVDAAPIAAMLFPLAPLPDCLWARCGLYLFLTVFEVNRVDFLRLVFE